MEDVLTSNFINQKKENSPDSCAPGKEQAKQYFFHIWKWL